MVSNVQWELVGLESIPSEKSCLIVSNHSSWFDIPAVLKAMMHTKIAVRFFVKRPILYIPLIGWGAWGIDCPFMHRYSKKYLQEHPERGADDADETKKSCAVFRGRQVFLLSYLEGTRFSKKKRELQGGEYRHLLKPKAGGIASALQAMGGQIKAILDFTISYPQGRPSCVRFLCGKPFIARVHVQARSVPEVGSGDYLNDPDSRVKYQNWVNGLWRAKDLKLDGEQLAARREFGGQLS
jgi:1-acyl-sn-glycerol-3-phosphate acyltransferase